MSLWKNENWPRFYWSVEKLLPLLLQIRRKQGELSTLKFLRHEDIYQALTTESIFKFKSITTFPTSAYRHFSVPGFPEPAYISAEMNRFLRWFNSEDSKIDGVLQAGISYLWFVTLRPFDDGHQRIGALISERALALDEKINFKRDSISLLMLKHRRNYLEILNQTQLSSKLEITPWLTWFCEMYLQSLINCENNVDRNKEKAAYWSQWSNHTLNPRQRKLLQAMLEFDQDESLDRVTNRKYVALTETSSESAKRDLADLLKKEILQKNPGSGRSTNYSLK